MTVDDARKALEATLENSDVGDVSPIEVLDAAEAYAEAGAKGDGDVSKAKKEQQFDAQTARLPKKTREAFAWLRTVAMQGRGFPERFSNCDKECAWRLADHIVELREQVKVLRRDVAKIKREARNAR